MADPPPGESPDDAHLPLSANGEAYTMREARHGVPLDYVAEKLASGITSLHGMGRLHTEQREALLPTMHYLLVAHLGLHNLLGKADDRTLATRLLEGDAESLDEWLAWTAREGGVNGLASLDAEAGRDE